MTVVRGDAFLDPTPVQPRTITLRRRKAPTAVGVAYDQQAVDAVPHLDYDERLEWVLTPSGAIKCTGA